MSNDFSGDSSCKALWRFEDGALTTDSKGAFTLTSNGSPAPVADTVDYREGSSCADLEKDGSAYFSLADTLGFPLASSDTNKKASFCFWMKPEGHVGTDSAIISKRSEPSGKSFLLDYYINSDVYFNWGYGTGTTETWWSPGLQLLDGTWYHFGVSIDGIAKTFKLRVWNGSTVINYTNTFANELAVTTATFMIGNCQSGSGLFDGRFDEVVVFNRVLTDAEIDSIRGGTYTGTPVSTVSDTLSLSENVIRINSPIHVTPIESLSVSEYTMISRGLPFEATISQSTSESLILSESLSVDISDQSISMAIQMGFNVRDSYGRFYTYGGIDSGYVERLENGTTFDGASIVSQFRTRDIPLGQWQYQAEVRKVKHMAVSKSTTTNNVVITHYGDACNVATNNKNDNHAVNIPCPVRSLTHRVIKKVESVGWGDFNFHAFDCTITTDNEVIAYEPIGLGIRYKTIREEMI